MARPPPPGVSRLAGPLGRGNHRRDVPHLRLCCFHAALQVVPKQGDDDDASRGGARPAVPLSAEGTPRGFPDISLLVRQNLAVRNSVSAGPTHVAQWGTRRGLSPRVGRCPYRTKPRGTRRKNCDHVVRISIVRLPRRVELVD